MSRILPTISLEKFTDYFRKNFLHAERKFQEKLPCLPDKEGAKNISTEICSAFLFSLKEVHEFLREHEKIPWTAWQAPSLSDKHGNFSWNFLSVQWTCFINNNTCLQKKKERKRQHVGKYLRSFIHRHLSIKSLLRAKGYFEL